MRINYKQLANVIIKVKQWEELTPEEEFVYLVHIEGYSEDQAIKKMTGAWIHPETFNYNSFQNAEQ